MAQDTIISDTQRIRLLTFNSFPDQSVPSETSDTDRFAAECIRFQNHYLQAPGLRSLGCDSPTVAIQRVVNSETSTVRSVIFSADADRHLEFGETEWSHAITTTEDAIPTLEQLPASVLSELQNADLAWLHVDLPEESRADGESFHAVITCIQQLATEDNDIIVLTAFGGQSGAGPGKFESLLRESDVRVPLWIRLPEKHGCAVQAITGSLDIPHTIQHALAEQGGKRKTENTLGHNQPTNLILIAINPGTNVERSLNISTATVEAVRSNDFLYAKRAADPEQIGAEDEVALYAKPEDVWNINNVAGEYQALASELNNLLTTATPTIEPEA